MRLSRRMAKVPPIDASASNAEIRELLLRRAREKGSALRWNGYTLILAYTILATITILELRDISTLPVAGVAVGGLVLIWAFSRYQAKKIEAQSLRDELRVYMEMLASRHENMMAQTARPQVETPMDSPLTERELQVLKMIAGGKSNKETATALHISDQTVKNHISHIFAKLDVNDRTSAVLLAIDHGWLRHPTPPPSEWVVSRPAHSDTPLDKTRQGS